MPKINKKFSFNSVGAADPRLLRALDDMYDQLVTAINNKASVSEQTTAPPASSPVNANYSIGDIWVETDTDTPSIMTSRTSDEAATWTGV